MTLLSQEISNIRVFAVPATARAAIVKWDSQYSDKFYQVYVNGKLAGMTVDIGQRMMVVAVPLSESAAARIEVFAVDGEFAGVDFSDDLSVQQGRVELRFVKSQTIPAGATVEYYFDEASGSVDYENRLNCEDINIWANEFDKGGFGRSSFGESDFGRDSACGLGFGKGVFGQGEFGTDCGVVKWQSGQLAKGKYIFGVKIYDRLGNEASQVESEQVTVIPPATPASSLSVSSFDSDSGEIIFEIENIGV